MNYEYTKTLPVTLEKRERMKRWLQELISKDPSILGLGEVIVIQRERVATYCGRIDLILSDNDPEEALRYEVEIMLGAVDESHIIRTIEYWDVERRRFPVISTSSGDCRGGNYSAFFQRNQPSKQSGSNRCHSTQCISDI
jgi:hypothetical protein